MRLGVSAWGCAGAERAVSPGIVRTSGGRATVERDDLVEWFENGPAGLEQGFNLQERPGACTSVRFVSVPSAGLRARVEGTEGVDLIDAGGVAQYRVNHAFAVDAAGRSLPVRFEPDRDGYALRVDIRSATFPVHVDPLAYLLEGTLTPPPIPGYGGGYFGLDVALYQDTAVVGAYLADSAGPSGSGAAFVFERSGSTWSYAATLTAPDPGVDDWFGWDVDVWGDTIVVGAMKDDTARGVDAGSVRVFRGSGGAWTQEAVIQPTTAGAESFFGCGVAIYGDTLVAGPYGGPDAYASVGSAYVFTRTGSVWTQEARLVPSADSSDRPAFGRKVSIWADTVAVGAMMEDGPVGVDQGAVYVFSRAGTIWSAEAKLRNGGAIVNGWFGYQVDIGSQALIGAAPGDWSMHLAQSISIFENDGSGYAEAASFAATNLDEVATYGPWAAGDGRVYQRGSAGWSLFASLPESSSVSIYDDTIVDGARVYRLGTALSLGAACVGDFECESAHCVEGVCCESACGGSSSTSCQACTAARTGAADGLCRPLTAAIAATTLCRASIDPVCDVPEYCSPSSTSCPTDAFAPAGTECRAALGPCDQAEACSGDDPLCPTDARVPTDTVCRAAAGACDMAEVCDGVSYACPADRLVDAGTRCRPSAGICDVDELCDGVGPACPADTMRPVGAVCRSTTGPCNPAEACTGSSASCPPDAKAASGTICRLAVGACDIAEVCDEVTGGCPLDVVLGPGTPCRDALDACDASESCDGLNGFCPADTAAPDGSACDDGLACDGADQCVAGVCTAGTHDPCDDGNACTTDGCAEPGGTCSHVAIAECCNADGDCDDGDDCTDDACPGPGGTCSHSVRAACRDAGTIRVDGGWLTDAATYEDADVNDGSVVPEPDAARPWDGGTGPSVETGCGCSVPGLRATSPEPLWALLLLAWVRLASRAGSRRRRRASSGG